MLNDRDGKYEGQDESEYHFTDEDVSYEVEPEPAKQPSGGGGGGGGPKESIGSRLSRSKRVLISAGVFLVLIFVVYKMVAPTSTTPTTDIATSAQNAAPQMPRQQVAPANQAPVVATQPNQAVAPTAMPTNNMGQPVQPGQQATMAASQAPLTQPGAPVVTVQAQNGAPVMQMQPTQQSAMPTQQQQAEQQAMLQQQAMQQQAAQQQAMMQQQPQQQPGQGVATMPAVIPVQSATTYNVNQPGGPVTTTTLSSDSERLMNQFQAEYMQKLNDYAAQNKATQEQLQALSSRVITMETQLNQLVQALTHHRGGASNTNVAPAQPPQQSIEPRLSYTVQAIIPGRAWLRSDSGETLTVAEGDMIKDLGRVTKIDPYDGIVEVNTGTKMVSLSYGNGS